MVRSLELVQQVILGALGAGLVTASVWLLVGRTPTWWVPMIGGEVLLLVVVLAVRVCRRRGMVRKGLGARR